MVGKTLSHYKILEELGRGGMGIVYKAEDTKLDRTVAIKVLPSAALASEDDRARFYREAKAAAQLHHPHIASVFEIDEAVPSDAPHGTEPSPFIAMEFIEGETLDARIKKGPLKLEEAVRIATQVASGLEAAHEKNIVHRDIKNGNVMLTARGEAKILDFGLAQTAQSTKLTRMGSTVGTVAFMSPEQARGEEVDLRTDLWSLGVVIYEMISGRSPFPGDYEQAVIYELLNQEPEPLTAIRTGVPMELERIVEKCLSKTRKHRYQHADELRIDLETVDFRSSKTSMVGDAQISHGIVTDSKRTWLPWAAGAFLGLLVGVVGANILNTGNVESNDQKNVERWNLVVPDEAPVALIGSSIAGLGRRSMVLSPDGSYLVYVAEHRDGSSQLYRRKLDSFDAAPLPGTEGAFDPVFSPDGRWIAFFADNKLKKIGLLGENPIDLGEVVNPMGLSWSTDDRLYFGNYEGSALSWLAPEGGSVQLITTAEAAGIRGGDWPSALPNTPHVLVNGSDSVYVVSTITGAATGLVAGGSSASYSSSGHLLYTQVDRLMAAPFDLVKLAVTGPSVSVVDQVRTEGGLRFAGQYTVSDTGTLVYVKGISASESKFVWVDDQGAEELLPFGARLYGQFHLSPDNKRLAATVLDISTDIWIFDLVRGGEERFTRDGESTGPLWTQDGQQIIFASHQNVDGKTEIYRRSVDGGATELIYGSLSWQFPRSFSQDGNILLFDGSDSEESKGDIYTLAMNEDRPAEIVIGTPDTEWGARFSPNGKHIAYISDAEGQYEVYVQPYPPTGQRWKISIDGGEEPVWSRTGRELFYRDANRWYVVPIELQPEFRRGVPELFVEGPYLDVPGVPHDVGLDGRLLLLKGVDEGRTRTQLNVVTNWFEELNRLAPSKQ